MSVEHIKSTPVTNLDATPVVPNTEGEGAQGYLREVTGSLVAPASASADSTFRFVRVPSNCKVKRVRITSQAQAAGKVDVGVYYPASTAHPDLAANAIDQDFFATDVDLASAVQPTDITNESGTYTADKWNQPLWQAVGLTSDPGGFFDIVGTVHTTAVTTGTGIVGLSVEHTA
jgi:hypothetical protein